MPLWQPQPAPGRYGALLLVLIVGYLLSAFITAHWVDSLQVVIFTVAMVLALRSSSVSRRAVRVLLFVAAVGVPVFFALSLSSATGNVGTGIANVWTGLVLLAAVVLIVHRVLTFGTVTLQSIYGAFSAYLIVGAILRFAVHVNTTYVDLKAIGVILMVTGVIGLIASVAVLVSRRRARARGTTRVYEQRRYVEPPQ